MGFAHISVMLGEVLEHLRPRDGGRYADGTLGGAGHAAEVLKASSPGGWLFGCDRDADALAAAEKRLEPYAGRYRLEHGNFDRLSEWLEPGSMDGVLLDLGCSSYQFDQASRGFSFQQDGPLDMRMDARGGLTAADLVNTAEREELARIFWELGEEPASRRLADAILKAREYRRIETTRQLAEVVERLMPVRGDRIHPATRIFQALRIAVNDELGSLERGLEAALGVLRPGGRLAVITFHSLEDRMVKEFGRREARDYSFPGEVDVPELRQPRKPRLALVQRKPLAPAALEVRENPRSRSAKLRVFERL